LGDRVGAVFRAPRDTIARIAIPAPGPRRVAPHAGAPLDPQAPAVAPSTSAAVEPASTPAAEGPTQAPAAREGRQDPARASDQGTATAPTSTSPSTSPAPAVDYKARFDGLQGVYQAEKAQYQQRLQAAETARVQLEQRAARAEAAAWENTWRLQGLSPEQIRDNKAVLAERQAIASEKAAVATERQKMRDEQAA